MKRRPGAGVAVPGGSRRIARRIARRITRRITRRIGRRIGRRVRCDKGRILQQVEQEAVERPIGGRAGDRRPDQIEALVGKGKPLDAGERIDTVDSALVGDDPACPELRDAIGAGRLGVRGGVGSRAAVERIVAGAAPQPVVPPQQAQPPRQGQYGQQG